MDRIIRHDLRNPLNGIIGAVQLLLLDIYLSDESRENVRLFEESSTILLTLIDASLNLHRMETGTYTFTPEAVALRVLFARIVQELKPEIDSEKSTLH